jgi:hypothetical protein
VDAAGTLQTWQADMPSSHVAAETSYAHLSRFSIMTAPDGDVDEYDAACGRITAEYSCQQRAAAIMSGAGGVSGVHCNPAAASMQASQQRSWGLLMTATCSYRLL